MHKQNKAERICNEKEVRMKQWLVEMDDIIEILPSRRKTLACLSSIKEM